MKLQYLGTAAAEYIPAIFCKCETCKKARENGGRDIRTRTQALLDDGRLCIDFSPDSYWHSIQYGFDLTDIHDYIITHSHSDHLYSTDVSMLHQGFANLPEDAEYRFHGGKSVIEKIENSIYLPHDEKRIKRIFLEPYKTVDIAGYNVTPLKAFHGTDDPYFYIIEKDGKSILWAHDTGYFFDEVWEYLEKNKPHFDFISLDCTNGTFEGIKAHHMSLDICAEVRDRLREIGCCDEKTVACVNHFSHNAPNVLYEDMKREAAKYGMICSYDGMIVEI
ncbi:MAG: PhnP protein [Ruminococcaceae bacterium]|nr:PhnP protein [Oscillospiraceae bacterium]